MRFRTCRESMLNSFKKSRDISGPIQVITKDELLEKKPILNKLCFLKLNIEKIDKTLDLENLFIINEIKETSSTNPTSIEIGITNVLSKNSFHVSIHRIMLLDSSNITTEWFREALKNKLGIDTSRIVNPLTLKKKIDKYLCNTIFENVNNHFQTLLHSTKFKNILFIDISKKEIEEIDPMKYKVKTIRSKLIVFDKRSKEVVKSYRIVKLIGNIDSIQEMSYRLKYQKNPYKDFKSITKIKKLKRY